MKKLFIILLGAALLGCTACAGSGAGQSPAAAQGVRQASTVAAEGLKITLQVNGKTLSAELEDNPTSRALLARLPLTLPMLNLYGREMCCRFEEALPTGTLRSDGYEVGDLAYWPPRHSFVILYKQNGERFERQHLGRITGGSVDVFNTGADMEMTITKAE